MSNDIRIGIWTINSEFVRNVHSVQSNGNNNGNNNEYDNGSDHEMESESESHSQSLYKLDRIIDVSASTDKPLVISKMIFLSTSTTRQLVMGCTSGTMILVDFKQNDTVKLIQKHQSQIVTLYQSPIDRFISASFDGLICVWRIEAECPSLLERINDTANANSKSPSIKSSSKKSSSNNKKEEDLRLNCFIDFEDEFNGKYFVISFADCFVILDNRFLVKCIVKNVYDGNADITAMSMFGEKGKRMLITVSSKHVIKVWDITGIQLHSIRTGLWFSCFRQELLLKVGRSKKSSNMASSLCIDPQRILRGRFRVHSAAISMVRALTDYCFVTCDAANQLILWKDAYYVSFKQNAAIRKYFNLPSYP